MKVGILLFDGVELLDFAGPYEVFSVASRIAYPLKQRSAAIEVVTIGVGRDVIAERHGVQLVPGCALNDAPDLDVLIVPGGLVGEQVVSPITIAYIRRTAKTAMIVASVCTGAFLLAEAGLLNGLRATTHWEDLGELRRLYPEVDVEGSEAFIDQGDIVTSAGIAAGISMSLHLLQRLFGEELAVRTARQMQTEWTPSRNMA